MISKLALITVLSVAQMRSQVVLNKISLLAPHVSTSVGLKVAEGLKFCKGLETNLVLSIIRVESNYKVGAVNSKSSDYGLMQVNNWHVKKKGLSKERLLTDVSYNMQEGCKILSYFVGRYNNIDEAIARYNCGTKASCVDWDGPKDYLKKVLTYKRKLDIIDVQDKN